MTVYVDAMRNWNKRIGYAGPYWAHMIADNLEELHAMANLIGLKRSWFERDHYDIGSFRIYQRALDNGCVLQSGKDWRESVRKVRLHDDA